MTTTTSNRPYIAPARPANPFSAGWRTFSNALIITRREVRDSFRDWRILAPIIILTFLFPFLAQVLASEFLDFVTGHEAQIIGERSIPFLLMVVGFFPISISLVIALETFVGEKERRSLEPLLSTPLTNTELYIGKTLAAMIPPLVSSYGGMAVYIISLLVTDVAWRPAPMLVFQIVLLTTVQALVMVTGAVVVSSQTTSTRAANLLASFIIIPMALIVQGESAIMFLAPDAESPTGIRALWAIIAGMMVVVVLLLRVGNSLFNREELLGSTIDQLNLRGFFNRIWRYTRAVDAGGGTATNLLDWYRRAIPFSLRRIRTPLLVAVAVFALAFSAGLVLGQSPNYQIPLPAEDDFLRSAAQFREFVNVPTQTQAMNTILWHNSRVLIGTLLLSVFTFGVAALVVPPLTFVVLGYMTGIIVISAGYDPLFMVAGILPHGIIELPVIALATAASLHVGIVVTRPPQGKTVGSVWAEAVGDVLKLAVGIIVPGLALAALIEAFITPQLVLSVLGV
ncbi:MAG: stage II sporulation protein M [Phototrophicaceae bacterium]